MKAFFIAISVFCFLQLAGPGVLLADDAAKSNPDLTPYKDADAGFAIKHPANWEKKTTNNPNVVAAFVAPNDPENKFAENVNIAATQLPGKADIAAVVPGLVSQLKDLTPGFKLVKSEAMKLDGLPAHKLVYTLTAAGMTVETEQVYCIVGSKLYVITLLTLSDRFEKWEGTFNAMVESFEFLKKDS